MEETITLKSIETKSTKAGAPMWTAITSTGKMSCFEQLLAEQLFTMVNKNLIVETEMKGQYKNLIRIIGPATSAPIPTAAAQVQQVQRDNNAPITMLLSYMKDQVVAYIQYVSATDEKILKIDDAWDKAYKNVMDNYKKIGAEI